jgi:hypothetical protein
LGLDRLGLGPTPQSPIPQSPTNNTYIKNPCIILFKSLKLLLIKYIKNIKMQRSFNATQKTVYKISKSISSNYNLRQKNFFNNKIATSALYL